MSEKTINGLTRDAFVWMLDDIADADADYTKALAWFDSLPAPTPAGGELADAVRQMTRLVDAEWDVDGKVIVMVPTAIYNAAVRALATYDASRSSEETGGKT